VVESLLGAVSEHQLLGCVADVDSAVVGEASGPIDELRAGDDGRSVAVRRP
jgi:hypothetical protein